MNRATVILFHGVLLVFIHVLVLAIASQQVDEGNYIVPRTTLQLSSNRNRSADGHKKICTSNLDCEMFRNNHCCLTLSGYSKCRKRCNKPRRRVGKYRSGKKGRSKNNSKHKAKNTLLPMTLGCIVGPNKVYKEGMKDRAGDGCNECKCVKGDWICTNRQCPPGQCRYRDKLYDDGYVLVLLNGCKRCICEYRSWNCSSIPCQPVVEQQNSAVSIPHSAVLALMCSVIHFMLLT
ncbi:uncharacterized protein LOC114522337 [Dendronephthya gigantea]|uniref:uncharacterized protein LOC114522337 n=1 Tax=Dendronephthya gigantea TaxID=151771 RepID=UPI001069D3D0|nr:uncharacterized protein LOC114522337 [Dendronephthya gigantea]